MLHTCKLCCSGTFAFRATKGFFTFPTLVLVHGRGGTATWVETCLAYALVAWLLGGLGPLAGQSVGHSPGGTVPVSGTCAFLKADRLWSWKRPTAVLRAAVGGRRAWRG